MLPMVDVAYEIYSVPISLLDPLVCFNRTIEDGALLFGECREVEVCGGISA